MPRIAKLTATGDFQLANGRPIRLGELLKGDQCELAGSMQRILDKQIREDGTTIIMAEEVSG